MNELMESVVEPQESIQDDAGLAPVEDTQEVTGESLDTIMEEPAEQPTTETAPPAKEPGWIKQRVDKAVVKAVREAEARVSAQYEAMLAPIRESVLDRQAEDLVKVGEFKNIETAKEYVRLKQGQPAQAPAPQQTAPQNQGVDPVVQARSKFLADQATKIKNTKGVDVAGVFNSDATVKQRVLSGEWDFYDVLDYAQANQPKQPRMPSPMRTTNGSGVNAMSVANMTDAQFKRLQANLAAGKIYDLSK